MKKINNLAIIFILVPFFAFAQRYEDAPFIQAGVKLGANLNKIQGVGYDEEFKFNYHLGGFLKFNIGEYWGIQPELIFNQSTGRTVQRFSQIYSGANTDIQNVRLNYLSIPILANFGINKLSFQVGPQYSILLNQNQNLFQNGREAFKSGDFALVGGVWVQLGKVNLTGRYLIGLSNLNEVSSSEKWKNQAIQIGIGYTF
ncbi:porin family protein [Thermoflexibacter ruber]|uniref:Outer membrane protein beta-barrel domain-containing protein n=1 Tax=Thermoflexibacter ruber TaxID=1003 RepID=A0A1I2C8J6_9BACT|nr:porin family protein [Thermoflexibacter ruber]SFE64584.1 Outer membrane protein beta-barrel domain-containing protein [Thermoflexibacter ruber]